VSSVSLSYVGVSGASVDGQGQLVLHTPSGRDLVQQAPVLYQTNPDGTRQAVAGGYLAHVDGTVGFHVVDGVLALAKVEKIRQGSPGQSREADASGSV
jgi:hypothetical protein